MSGPVEVKDQRAHVAVRRAGAWLVAVPERGSRDACEYLLLVVHEPAFVGAHVRGIVRRREERVDVLRGDDQPEVVADEAPSARAGIARAGARVLREPPHVLPRLLGIPRVPRESTIRADSHRAEAGVLVRLKRDVDTEVRSSHVGRKDARVARTGGPAVVAGAGARPR